MASSVQAHNALVLRSLERGDLVEFKRGMYSHWGVYKGDEEIIHLAGDQNDGLNANITSGSCFTICGTRFNKAFVRVDSFWAVAADCRAYKNNASDKKKSPRPADQIIREALDKLGEIGYNVLWANCEHFAKWCRYGEPSSDQVDGFLTGATVTAGVALLAVGLSYLFGSKEEKKEKEKALTS